MIDADRPMANLDLLVLKGRLATASDNEVIAAYEAATGTFDGAAMSIAADEMQRRHLDY